mmetsp:Transcript_29406/g.71014  ORF Transcript_29406/g.71014 Transcript_29406/m.71014 type:complete len:213 (-) Transcript_29406:440-1078(-)
MGHLRRPLVLLPDFDRLVRLARHEPRPRQVELGREYPVLGVEAPGLGHGGGRLEAVPGAVIPKVHRAVVRGAEDDAVVVHGEGVDDALVAREIFDEASVGSHPLFEVVGRAGDEGVFEGRLGQRADRLFVVGEGRHALARGEVPQFDGGVVGSGDDLRIRPLGQDRAHRIIVSRQTVHLVLRPHIPHPRHGVPPPRDQQVQRGMQLERENSR